MIRWLFTAANVVVRGLLMLWVGECFVSILAVTAALAWRRWREAPVE